MLRYFWKDSKPSILVELKHRDLELENFDQIVENVVNVEAKAALQSRSSTRNIDQYYFNSNQIANSTVIKNQGSIMKELRLEKPKIRGSKLLSDP